jgi:hypothetical protein
MRFAPVLAAGLAGLMTLPAVAAGPVGLDAVTQWLRGITGTAQPPDDETADTTPRATTATTGNPANSTRAQAAPPVQRPGATPRPLAVGSVPLATLDDFTNATRPASSDDANPSPAIAAATAALRGRTADGRTAPGARAGGDVTGSLRGAVRPVAPVGQRALPDDPQAETEDLLQPQRYRVGSFTVQPLLDAGIGRTSNVEGRAGSGAGSLYRLRSEATIASDWSRHAFEATLRAGYDGYPTRDSLNTPTYDGAAKLRLDLMDETHADLALRFNAARGKASSAENPAGTAIPSTTTTTGVSAGLTRAAGIVGVTLRGDVDRTSYSGGQLVGGGAIASDAARDNTRVALALRVGLTSDAVAKPYVELQGIRREFDAASMSGRDSQGIAGKVGATIDFGPVLRGDVAAGWTREVLEDDSLGVLDGATLDASLLWSPTRLTEVNLSARTTLDPTTLAGSPGSVGRRAAIAVRHALRRAVIASAGVGGAARRYEGLSLEERTVSGEAELAYRFNPHAEVYGRGEWARFSTTTPGANYSDVTVMTGLRLR